MEKYCLNGCKELEEWVEEYNERNSGNECDIIGNFYTSYYYLSDNREGFRFWNIDDRLPEGYTLLSFEEFKRIVLDGNLEEQNFNIWN